MAAHKLDDYIANVLSIARLAPSVHNTQPWLVKAETNSLLIFPDKDYLLSDGDPTGRETAISFGIFSEACVIGLETAGFQVKNIMYEAEKITISIESGSRMLGNENIEALKSRFTDRSIYQKIKIPKQVIYKIENSWRSKHVRIKVITDEQIINKAASLTRKGISLALSNPAFRSELSRFLVFSNKTVFGIPVPAMKVGLLRGVFTKLFMKVGWVTRSEARLEEKRWKSASAIVAILSKGDSAEYWFESGRAYLRASLEIQKAGLRQATSAAIVEAADFHEDIEKELGTMMRLQCLIRIGKSNARPYYSGRKPVESLLIK